MPAKRQNIPPRRQQPGISQVPTVAGLGASSRRGEQPGFILSTFKALRSPENASVVRSVAIFGVAVAFLHSSWAEALVPQF
ncbi:hypothetical protein BDZ91DRAFT_714003 [Kalaharituber pfeilii]|nr:hypothetical protein BDZ91DRAFT_714003 [Kalaharituber pfeilii]